MKHLFILLFFSFTIKGDTNDEKYKSDTIEKIVKKVCNITLDSVANAPLEEKPKILMRIEEKLNKSAVSLGVEGHKYVKLLMHGVKLIAYNNKTLVKSNAPESYTTDNKTVLRTASEYDENEVNLTKSKDEIIINIEDKIQELAKAFIKVAKTPEKKQQALEMIKNKVLDSANKKRDSDIKNEEVKNYSDLIAQGIDLMARRYQNNNTRRKAFHIKNNGDLNSKADNVERFISNKVDDESDCSIITEKVCRQLTTLGLFSCSSNDKSIPLEKFCDDVFDCPDQSDENNCVEQGTDRIHQTTSLLSQINSPNIHDCFVVQLSSSVVSRQNEGLKSVLDTQLNFIQKYSNTSIIANPKHREKFNKYVLKKYVNEIAMVVTTLAVALEGALCSRRRSIGILDQLREMTLEADDDDLDAPLYRKQNYWPPMCECNGLGCANITCESPCPKICTQKNSFSQWTCESVNGSQGVPASVLCDGKIDCYDRSDETNCSYGATHARFVASGYFYDILNIVKQKAVSQEYLPVQYKLLALHGSVVNLQKLSISQNIENDLIKEARDQCFATLTSLYEYLLLKSDNEGHLDSYYTFLNTIKEKLLRGLKLGNTGNEKYGATDECICIADRCGMAECSKVCMKACPVHSKITRFYCGSTKSNITVPIELLCDGKFDCPMREDEDDCKQEMCRKHHLVLISQSFEYAGRNLKGTSVGEALLAWKSKAKSLITLVEREKMNSQLIKKLVEDILEVLVTTYGSIDDFRRSASKSRQLLKQFIHISRQIIDTVKNCGNIN